MVSLKVRSAQAAVFCAVLTAGMASIPTGAGAAPVVTKCGAVIGSTVKTEGTALFETGSTSFVNLPGAAVNVVVPAGASRCVKLRLSVIGYCSDANGGEQCFVRASADNVAMEPPINGMNLLPPSPEPGGYSFQWVKRLNAGTHTIKPQFAVGQALTTALHIEAWTLEVEWSE